MKVYCLPVRVYYEDTDHGGVVYYANYLKFMERCRTEMLRAKGLEQDQLIKDMDLIFAVRHAEVDYLSPAKFNDHLIVTAQVVQSSKVRVQFKQTIFHNGGTELLTSGQFVNGDEVKNNNSLICDAKISVVSLSASQLRPKRIPNTLFEELLSEH
jgi:acyl-CoA thioester hydrolase